MTDFESMLLCLFLFKMPIKIYLEMFHKSEYSFVTVYPDFFSLLLICVCVSYLH